MRQMVYKDQFADELRLNLIGGTVDKQLLSVLSTGEVDVPYGKVQIGIIGASHFFNFNLPSGETVFTEVFACTNLKEKNRLHYGDLQDSSSIKKHIGDITYKFAAKKSNWNSGQDKFEEILEQVNSCFDNYQVGLIYRFPSEVEGEFPPVTVVYCKVNPSKLDVEVRTLHAYPNEGSLVFTETTIQSK